MFVQSLPNSLGVALLNSSEMFKSFSKGDGGIVMEKFLNDCFFY